MNPETILKGLTEFFIMLNTSSIIKIMLVFGIAVVGFTSVIWAFAVYMATIQKITPAGPVRWAYHSVFLGVIPFFLFFSRPPLTVWIDPLEIEIAAKWFYLAGFILWGYLNLFPAWVMYTWSTYKETKKVDFTMVAGGAVFMIIFYGIYEAVNFALIIL